MSDKTHELPDAHHALYDLISRFRNAMLVTKDPWNGGFRARPMSIAGYHSPSPLYFVTARGTEKVDEIVNDPVVGVTMQGSTSFVSLSGRAHALQDKELMKELWNPAFKPWFPDGPTSDDAVIVAVHIARAEYWNQTMGQVVRSLFDAGRAVLDGERIDLDGDVDHRVVRLAPEADQPTE